MEAVLLGVGDSHVELLAPLGPDTAVGKFLERNGPGLHHVAYGTDDIESRPGRVRGGRPAADRRAAPHRHPRQPRGVPAPEVDRRGADRASPSCGRALMADDTRRIDIGFQGGPVLPARVKQSAYDELHKACPRTARIAGSSWRRSTRRSPSTCPRSYTCGSTPKSSGSASRPPVLADRGSCDCCARAATRRRWSGPLGCTRGRGSTGLLWYGIAAVGYARSRRPDFRARDADRARGCHAPTPP